MIRKEGSGYSVFSEDGSKRLSKPASHKKAVKRLQQIEYFKHVKKSVQEPVMNQGQIDMGYEDMMTTLETLASAQPEDQARFLKSIANTPQGDQIKAALGIYAEAGKPAEGADLSKSFREAFEKLK